MATQKNLVIYMDYPRVHLIDLNAIKNNQANHFEKEKYLNFCCYFAIKSTHLISY